MIYNKNHVELFESLSFWRYLNEEERCLLRNRATIVHHRTGQHILGGNNDCLGFIRVVEGILRAYLLSPDGREITLYRIKAGDTCMLSASCILDAISFETQIVVEEDCDAFVIPNNVYSILTKNNIYVECDSYKMAMERFSDVVSGMERLVFLNMEQRIISFLLDEVSENGIDTIQMTHEQIAVNIGSAREVVSRSLKNMATKGWIELFRGGVRLLDRSSLYKQIS